MKKMKGVATAMESSPSPYAAVYKDPRTRFKHQSLMQDYEELYKETEAKTKKFQMLQQKKLTLLAEVRFLRRRHKYFTQSQSQRLPVERNHVEQHNFVAGSKNVRKERNYGGKDASLQFNVPGFDLSQKGKIHNERKSTARSSATIFDLNHKQKTFIAKEVALRNSATVPDLNQKGRIFSGMGANVRNFAPIFDLNQISMEEEELQANGNMMRIEDPKIISIRGGSDEQHNDMNLSACRNVGNGSSRAGKRKISWRDQVALRV